MEPEQVCVNPSRAGGRAGKGCTDMDPRDHAALERERGDAGVLLIVVALAFRLDGGLLVSRDRN